MCIWLVWSGLDWFGFGIDRFRFVGSGGFFLSFSSALLLFSFLSGWLMIYKEDNE